MKRLKKWVLPLFTLLLVAVGAAMPFIVSYMQDAQQAEADIRPFDSFSLTLQQQGSDLGRILRTIANGAYYINEASKAEDAALTEGLALSATEDLLTELVKYGLLNKETLARFYSPKIQAQRVIPVIYTDTEIEGYASAVLPGQDGNSSNAYVLEDDAISTWTITWDQPDNVWIWLDDASGKVIMIEIPCLSGLGIYDGSNAFGERVYALVENWRTFLSDYYSTEVQVTDEEWYDDAVKFALSFPLGASEDQEIFSLDLYFYFSYYFSILSPYVS